MIVLAGLPLADGGRGYIATAEETVPADVPSVLLADQSAPQPTEPQVNMDELLREQQIEIEASTDKQRGINRLNEYAAAGLGDTQANADAIRTWLNENLRGYLSEQGVDLAVQWLGPRGKNVLTWRPKEAPPQAIPEPAGGETLEPWRLPLDADERTMKAASVKSLQDLIKRRRSATNQKYVRRGGFSSIF